MEEGKGIMSASKDVQMTLDNSGEIIAANLKSLQDAQVLLKEAGIRLAQCIRDTKNGPGLIDWDEYYEDLSGSLSLVGSNTDLAAKKVQDSAMRTSLLITERFGTEEKA